MAEAIQEHGILYQFQAWGLLRDAFGELFAEEVYPMGLKIKPAVLREFRKLTPDVLWDRSDQCWVVRRVDDPPEGRLTRESMSYEELRKQRG